MPSQNRLPFEKDIAALEEAIARLEAEANGSPDSSDVNSMTAGLRATMRSPTSTCLAGRPGAPARPGPGRAPPPTA